MRLVRNLFQKRILLRRISLKSSDYQAYRRILLIQLLLNQHIRTWHHWSNRKLAWSQRIIKVMSQVIRINILRLILLLVRERNQFHQLILIYTYRQTIHFKSIQVSQWAQWIQSITNQFNKQNSKVQAMHSLILMRKALLAKVISSKITQS
jgi:hypothetical protein